MALTLSSLFSGLGGFELSGMLAGIEPKWLSEIEPFPLRVTAARFPNVKPLGSVTDINGAEIEPVDIVTFGSPCQDLSVAGKQLGIHEGQRSNLFFEAIRIIKEMRKADEARGRSGKHIRPRFAVWENVCFTADTLVACHDGYKRIADIAVGDSVRTLSGEYHPVARLYKTQRQEVMKVKVSGGEDLTVTPNHPFYAREKVYANNITKQGRVITDPKWIRADELTANHLVGYLIDKPTLPEDFISGDEAWAIGRWIADGSVDLSKSSPRIFISCGLKKADATRERLNMLKYDIHENHPHPTAINFAFTSNDFYALISQVGCGAGNKKIPQYVFELPRDLQREVLQGYIDGDGHVRQRGKGIELTAGTASRELAYGVARLIRDVYGVAANITRRETKDGKIGGRVIHANYPTYVVTTSLTSTASMSYNDGNIVWQPVHSVELLKERQNVYNLSVLEDNTYGANDVLVHNCGAMSSNKGEDFRAVIEALSSIVETDISIPQPKKWDTGGGILGNGWSIAWRVYDAQYWGVAQRRKRIYLIADFGSERAVEILSECEGLPWDSTESRTPWEGTAADAERGVGRSGGVKCLNPWDCQSKRQYDVSGVYRTLDAGESAGGQAHGVVYEPKSLMEENWAERDAKGALRAEPSKSASCVVEPAAFMGGQGAKARSIAYCDDGSTPTLKSAPSGGNTVPDVVYALQGNGIDRADTAGCNGKGWREDAMYTLDTVDRPAVVYPDKAKTLVARHDSSPCVDRGQNVVCYGVDCRNATLDEEKTHTVQAKANGGISLNCTPSVCYRNSGYGDMVEGVGTLRANGGDAGGGNRKHHC